MKTVFKFGIIIAVALTIILAGIAIDESKWVADNDLTGKFVDEEFGGAIPPCGYSYSVEKNGQYGNATKIRLVGHVVVPYSPQNLLRIGYTDGTTLVWTEYFPDGTLLLAAFFMPILYTLIFVLFILGGIWLYYDTKERKKNTAFWLILYILLDPVIALVVYFVATAVKKERK